MSSFIVVIIVSHILGRGKKGSIRKEPRKGPSRIGLKIKWCFIFRDNATKKKQNITNKSPIQAMKSCTTLYIYIFIEDIRRTRFFVSNLKTMNWKAWIYCRSFTLENPIITMNLLRGRIKLYIIVIKLVRYRWILDIYHD